MRATLSMCCLMVLQAACVHESGDRNGGGCYSRDDCPEDDICFLGTCQSAGFNIQRVHVDLMPSTATGFLQQADPENPRDLGASHGLMIRVRDAATLRGRIISHDAPLGGVVTAQLHRPDGDGVVLPSSQATQQTVVGSDQGFELSLIPGTYDLTARPTHGLKTPLPPLSIDAYTLSAEDADTSLQYVTALDLHYPVHDLLALSGNLIADANTRTPVVGARVTSMAIDGNGNKLVAAPTVTDANGRYTLHHLPGAQGFTVVTHPGASDGENPLIPAMTFTVVRDANRPAHLGTHVLGAPTEGVSVALDVRDTAGKPVTSAAVQFSGWVGPAALGGTFRANAISDGSGVARAALLPGVYGVSVLPGQGRERVAALILEGICVSAEDDKAAPCGVNLTDAKPLTVTLAAQIEAEGVVTDHRGRPLPGARVEYATAVDATHRRTFAIHTDPNGRYALHVDPGTFGAPRPYELSIEPPPNSAIPRYRELVRVGDSPLIHDVHIYAPVFVYGTVQDPNGEGLSDVTIALYSTELGSAGQPLLIGLGKSLSGGEFAIPIPTANGEH